MYSINLNYVPGIDHIYLRDLRGVDELDITSSKSEDAIRLINRLLSKRSGFTENLDQAGLLPIAERDYVLVGIYQRIFGNLIESSIRCQKCNEPFDIDFQLSELVRHLWSGQKEFADWNLNDGTFNNGNKLHFRLPTGEDECAVLHLPPEAAKRELLRRCLLSSNATKSLPKLEEILTKVAPLVETNLNCICPECKASQEIFFSIQNFLLTALLNERKQILREIHLIAMAYKWSHNEIVNLPRSIRKTYVKFIEKELDYT